MTGLSVIEPAETLLVTQGGVGHNNSAFTLTSGTAYFAFQGTTTRPITPTRVYFQIHVTAGTGAQTAEIGLFSSITPPNKTNLTLSKIVSTGTVDALTSIGLKGNTSAFSTVIPPGTHLWAGLRVAMATTQPRLICVVGDRSLGYVQNVAAAALLTDAGPWSGVIPGVQLWTGAASAVGAALHVSLL